VQTNISSLWNGFEDPTYETAVNASLQIEAKLYTNSGVWLETHTWEVAISTYTITYSANGATGGTVPASQTKMHDVPIILRMNSGNLSRNGYAFAGWNTQSNGGGTDYAPGNIYAANASTTLYAKWSVATLPDLIVESIELQAFLGNPSPYLRGIVKLRNIGNAVSGNFSFRVNFPFAVKLEPVSGWIPSLYPGDTYQQLIQGAFRDDPAPGIHDLAVWAQADDYNQILEWREDNNTLQKTLVVVVPPWQLELLAPNGGEEIAVQERYLIKWKTYGAIPAVNLEISCDGGISWELLESKLPNTDEYQWEATEHWSSPTCLIRISDAQNSASFDVSNKLFQVFVCTLKYDLDGNCLIDLNDVALLAAEWLQSGNPYK